MLRSWRGMVNKAAAQADDTVGSPAAVVASAEQAEIRRLRRDLERAQIERDILKKAIGIDLLGPPR
jgi:transposase